MKIFKMALLSSLLVTSQMVGAETTFNAVEKGKKYNTEITGLPSQFEDEEFDQEEVKDYNRGHEDPVVDEYDLPGDPAVLLDDSDEEKVVDLDREESPKEDLVPSKKSPSNKHVKTVRESK